MPGHFIYFRKKCKGIFSDVQCSNSLIKQVNHCISIVGYGYSSESNIDFWIGRNSWGNSWGEKGYVRILRNAGNQLCISSFSLYPSI
jgi:cathepsin L